MDTRKYPRTMAEAFGPYTNNVLHPIPDRRIGLGDVLRAVVTIAAFASIGVMLAWRG